MKETKNNEIPPYLSTVMRQMVIKLKTEGVDVIDFTVGDPDLEPPKFLIDELIEQVNKVGNHRYPSNESQGMSEFRSAVASMYLKRFGVRLDPDENIISLIGSKEGAHYLSLSLAEQGDVVIVCEPGYMTYKPSGVLAKAEIYSVAAHEEDNYLPRLETIPIDILKRTRLFFVNYPNNPTGAVAPLSFFTQLVNMAQEYDFIVCNDNAYCELYYGDEKPPSILQIPGSLDVAVEMNSLSKTFNVCGWRTGMLLGNGATIKSVLTLKQNTDAGIFMPLQLAGAKALLYHGEYQEECRRIYSKRSSLLVNGLKEIGFDVSQPKAGMFVWVKVPDNQTSIAFCETMIAKCGIACNPGSGFGNAGQGYARFALTVGTERIEEALDRIKLYY